MPIQLILLVASYFLPTLLSLISGHFIEISLTLFVSIVIGGVGLYIQAKSHATSREQLQATLVEQEEERDTEEGRLVIEREKQEQEQLRFWMDQARVSRDEAILQRDELREAREERRRLLGELEKVRDEIAATRRMLAKLEAQRTRSEAENEALQTQRAGHIETAELHTASDETPP